MKYISPGGWFSLEYPMGWHEFEDTEESFLFYNPDRWTGNFRISAYKDEAADYGPQCIAYELKENTSSTLVKVGKWDCAYSAETFQEEGAWYTTHIWVTGAFEWASTTIKKQLTKDFTASESDIDSIQQVMDSGRFQTQQRMAWENFGIAFGAILVNEMEGMEWVTVIEGQKEYPALQFMCSDMVLDPAALVWGKAKKGLPCDLKSEFRKIKREAEAVLDDLNK